MSDNRSIACNLAAIDKNEREQHKANSAEVFTAIEEWLELFNGYAFRLPTDSKIIEKAAVFMARERQCCPFFEFNLEVTPESGPVWLKLTGNQKVKEFIKHNIIPQLKQGQPGIRPQSSET
ncbi:hypothetical protein [Fodinibius sp.]|uniref:hypothetical protein n=1 Tax=Fodinibius sp. TaxID=1872440 RepID=UPI002ACD44BE|nr:hypothetical protein [Fodinibius sp.]MDZ7659395.1 hypothetical protein [Fodinibius sp.]